VSVSMPALLMHLTAVERLAAHGTKLPAEFVRALGEDLEYARFGAALPELPWFGGLGAGVGAVFFGSAKPSFTALAVDVAPVSFGLKAAELVANGALVGTEAGLAFLAGYFTQLCVRRAVEPLVKQVVRQHSLREAQGRLRARIEWAQSVHLLQELHGGPLLGTPGMRAKLQVRKASGPGRVGRGLYELMRVSSIEAFGQAPQKHEVDGWLRGLYVFSVAAASPLARFSALAAAFPASQVYRSANLDVFAALDQGLDTARDVISSLGSMIRRNSFSARARAKLLEVLPEGAP
jgi:hypothetical protein